MLFWNQVTELWETWSHSAVVAQLLEILCSQRGNARATRDSTPFWRNTEDPQGWPTVSSGRVFVRSGSCNFLVVCCRYSSWIECIERYIWHTDVFNVCMYDYSLCYILFHSATLTAKHLQCWGHSLFWEAFNQPWKRSILWFVQQMFENKLWMSGLQSKISGKIIHSLKLTYPLKMVVSNRNLLFQGSIFRGYVSFREGDHISKQKKLWLVGFDCWKHKGENTSAEHIWVLQDVPGWGGMAEPSG